MTHAWMDVLAVVMVSFRALGVPMPLPDTGAGLAVPAVAPAVPAVPAADPLELGEIELDEIQINAWDSAGTAGIPPLRKHYVVVERIDGGVATLETPGGTVELPVASLPPGITEGDVLEWRIDRDEWIRRMRAASDRIARLQAMSWP